MRVKSALSAKPISDTMCMYAQQADRICVSLFRYFSLEIANDKRRKEERSDEWTG